MLEATHMKPFIKFMTKEIMSKSISFLNRIRGNPALGNSLFKHELYSSRLSAKSPIRKIFLQDLDNS